MIGKTPIFIKKDKRQKKYCETTAQTIAYFFGLPTYDR